AARGGSRLQLRLRAVRDAGVDRALRPIRPPLRRSVSAGAVLTPICPPHRWVVRAEAPGRGFRRDVRGVADAPLQLAPQVRGLAAGVLAPLATTLADKIVYWTGLRRSLAKKLVEQIVRRARELDLRAERGREEQQVVDVTVLATTLAMNYLQRGQFTER